MMQIALLFASISLAFAGGYGGHAGVVTGYGAGGYGGGHGGYGLHAAPAYAAKVYAPEPVYPPHPYSFGYDIDDGYGTKSHQKEDGDEHGGKRGSYGYTDAYGIYRQVDYIADDYGFRATIKTNEPGTASQSPADVSLYANPVQTVHKVATHHAPVYAAPAYSAPKAVYAPAYGHGPSYASPQITYAGGHGYDGY